MSEKTFSGFPSRAEVTPIPNLFFTAAMQHIDSIAELKTVLHIFWVLSHRRGYPQLVTTTELLADPVLRSSIDEEGAEKEKVIRQALKSAVDHGIVLQAQTKRTGKTEDVYLINNDAGREAINLIRQGNLPDMSPAIKLDVAGTNSHRDIYTLYEHNVGMLNPLIAEQLQEAEKLYPLDWIEAAFKEAVSLNKRSWKYISKILERWATEGKDDGKFGRDTEKERDREKYIRGKYGHMVKG
jgi:DNA replication protein